MIKAQRKTTTAALLLALLLALLAGCAAPRVDVQPAPAPSASATGAVRPPVEVVADFRATLRTEDVSTALFLLDEVDYSSPAAGQLRLRMKRLSDDMTRGGYDFRPVEELVRDGCAAVIVRETTGQATGGQFAVFYLIQRNSGWKLSPEPAQFERINGLTAAQRMTFHSLEKWFQLRKADLIVEDRNRP